MGACYDITDDDVKAAAKKRRGKKRKDAARFWMGFCTGDEGGKADVVIVGKGKTTISLSRMEAAVLADEITRQSREWK